MHARKKQKQASEAAAGDVVPGHVKKKMGTDELFAEDASDVPDIIID